MTPTRCTMRGTRSGACCGGSSGGPWPRARIRHPARCSRFVGLDLNEDDIAYCKARLEYEGDDRLEFRVQDVVAEPLRSEDAAEIVVCSEVVEHLEKPEALLENIADVLPCGGYLILTTPNGAAWSGRVRRALGWVPPTTDGHGHISVYGRKEWRRRCRRAGLVLVTERRGSIAYGAVGIDRRRVLAGALIASDAVFDLLRLKDLSWETLQLYRKD